MRKLLAVLMLLPALARADVTATTQNGIHYRSPDQIAADTDQLKQMVVALQQEVDELKTELKEIRAKLDGTANMPTAPNGPNPGNGHLMVGMTEAQVDAAENKTWKKVVVDVSESRTVVEYRSPTRWSSGFQEKDTCWFANAKLVRFQPTRAKDQ